MKRLMEDAADHHRDGRSRDLRHPPPVDPRPVVRMLPTPMSAVHAGITPTGAIPMGAVPMAARALHAVLVGAGPSCGLVRRLNAPPAALRVQCAR